MLFFTHTLVPILFSLTVLWFVIAVIVFIVKFIGSNKTQDPVQKKLERKKAWRMLLYPVLFFIFVVIINSFIAIASGSASSQ